MRTYDQTVESAKEFLGKSELWIFEDPSTGNFHTVKPVGGQSTIDHYCNVAKWIPRGRVETEIKVTTMWTGGVLRE